MGPFDGLTALQRQQIREAHAARKIAAARTDRGTCRSCGGDYQLTKRGLVRRHEMAGHLDCPGGGKPPAEG